MRPLSDAFGLSRRDFVEGALVATGGLAFGSLAPQRAVAATAACGDALAGDARLLRGGNLPSVFAIGHLMRDGRLTFRRDDVIVAAGCDGREGASPIIDDGEEADVIVAGGGLGGLSAAFYLLRRRPDIKLRILEANQFLGGNASCDDSAPLPVRASSCGAYAAAPYTDYLKELYAQTGVSPEKYPIKSP
ncbi:MAG TPA: NAD(P)-binding protein, partial [Methylocystis sp.]|nr:NAD(P)-binding protein [Methylocystis sp.]